MKMSKCKERVELHCHSVFSELDGVSRVKDIIQFAVDNHMPAVAITDHASVAGFGEAACYSWLQDNIKMIYGMEAFVVNDLDPAVMGDKDFIMNEPSFHVTFLILNELGKRNLYKMMTISEEFYKGSKPRIPWSEIQKYREGLLIGSACEVGELYLAIMDGALDVQLEKIASKYDYIEVQPAENKLCCVDEDECSYEEGLDYIRRYDRKVIEIGEKLGKIVVATGDVHFVTEKENVVRAVLQRYVGYDDDYQLKLQFRTTEEMLSCFSYLGEEKAWEIVVENSNKIADMIEEVNITYNLEEHYPVLDDASDRLREICYARLEKEYGNDVEQYILDQLNWELDSMTESGADSGMLLAKELIEESGIPSYAFGYRGTLGASLVAYLCGVTCVNPIEAKVLLHPEFLIGLNGDKKPEFSFNFPTDIRTKLMEVCNDLEEVGAAIHAGRVTTLKDSECQDAVKLYEKYHNISFSLEEREWIEECLSHISSGYIMNPGAMLLIPEWYEVFEFTPLVKQRVSGHMISGMSYHNLDNLSRMYLLTNQHINMLHRLVIRTGKDVSEISLEDSEVGAVLGGFHPSITAKGIPEFNTDYARSIAKEFGVDSFTDVIQLICLKYSTGAWEESGRDLLLSKVITKNSVIASREDVFDCLILLGLDKEKAFQITEYVRKGKASYLDCKWMKYREQLINADAPEWFIRSCEKIKYLFSRAHAYIYALHAWWIAWFKIHYTKEFYEVYLELVLSDNLREVVSEGKVAFETYKVCYYEALADGFINDEVKENKKEQFMVVEEMMGLIDV